MLFRTLLVTVVAVLSSAPLFLPNALLAQDKPIKYALLVGVTKYQHNDMNKPQLEYPEVDAKALAEVLKQSGYTVDSLLGPQATQGAIRTKLAALKRQGNGEGVVFVGLFGHGSSSRGPTRRATARMTRRFAR